jgi:O-antigen/teichoic acid export membrane protein
MRFTHEILKIKFAEIYHNPNIRKNLNNSLYYFGGTFIQFLIAIITQPIFSKYLELEDFGIMGYYNAVQALLFPLFSMTLPFYYMAQYWTNNKGSDGSQNLSFILNFLNVSNGLIAIVSFIFISLYFKFAHVIFPLTPFIFIVLANLFFEKYKIFYLLECRIQKQGLRFLLLNVIQTLVNTTFSLYFVIALKSGAVGRMSGILIGVIFLGIISLALLIKEKKYKFSIIIEKSKVKMALKYCTPLIIGAYAYYPIGNIDRLLLERIGNISEFGYYNIGLTISGFAGTFFLAFYQSFEPDLYKLIAQKRYKQYLIFVFFYIIILAVLSVLFILVSNPIVSFLTAGRFIKASGYSNVFIIGIFFMQVGGIFEQLFTAYGATKLAMWRNILMGIFCIIMYYIMIDKYQFSGANITRILSSVFYIIVGALLFIFLVKKKKNVAFETIKIETLSK